MPLSEIMGVSSSLPLLLCNDDVILKGVNAEPLSGPTCDPIKLGLIDSKGACNTNSTLYTQQNSKVEVKRYYF